MNTAMNNAVRHLVNTSWSQAEERELDRLDRLPPGNERGEAFFALYHSHRKRTGQTYDADAAARYETRDAAAASPLFDAEQYTRPAPSRTHSELWCRSRVEVESERRRDQWG